MCLQPFQLPRSAYLRAGDSLTPATVGNLLCWSAAQFVPTQSFCAQVCLQAHGVAWTTLRLWMTLRLSYSRHLALSCVSQPFACLQVGSKQPGRTLRFDASPGADGAFVWAHNAMDRTNAAGKGSVSATSACDMGCEPPRHWRRMSDIGPTAARDTWSLYNGEEAQLVALACQELSGPCSGAETGIRAHADAAADDPGPPPAASGTHRPLEELIEELELGAASPACFVSDEAGVAHDFGRLLIELSSVCGAPNMKEPDVGFVYSMEDLSRVCQTQQVQVW